MNSKIKYLTLLLVSVVFIVSLLIITESDKETLIYNRLSKYSEHVKHHSILNKIDPRVYISILYGELACNMNIFDEFDNIRADFGFDPSVGFGQMRVSTFLWLEHNHCDGENITKSENNNELIAKIKDDSTNIVYTTFYVGLIKKRIKYELQIEPSVKLLGSYYSFGIDNGQRDFNPDFRSPVGIAAEEFYNSNKLLTLYPRFDNKIVTK